MNDNPNLPRPTTRRQFLKTSSTAALGGVFAAHLTFPAKPFAANADTLKVGLIGCGGRGTGAASQALAADPHVVLTAMGDVFENQLQTSLESLRKNVGEENQSKVQVDPEHRFIGFDAYQKVIDSGVDVVILATPPGFRPAHLKAAIAAGKHVFCEKPMAVDAPGVRAVLEAAEEARRKRLSLVSGFCWRYHYPKREIFSRILDGAIGEITSIYTTYNTGPVRDQTIRKEGWTEMQVQMRNWYQFAWLSGDHIAEQAVHSIDMMSWVMRNKPPLRAIANGGRQVRTSYGHIYDHFGVVYEYDNGIRGFHFCRQQAGCSTDYAVTVHGTKGNGVADCSRNRHIISGENPWRFAQQETPVPDMYQVEHNELFASIRKGEPMNDGIWMAYSTLLAIMGRMAAYTGQTITWEEALNSKEDLLKSALGLQPESPEPQLSWDSPIKLPPVALPGRTAFV